MTQTIKIAENFNISGSPLFKKLVQANNFEKIIQIANSQIKAGAKILDLCMAHPEFNEELVMKQFFKKVKDKINIPWMIDSNNHKLMNWALKQRDKNILINSINLGQEKSSLEQVIRLAKKYQIPMVVGLIDENKQMAIGSKSKLELAQRSYSFLVDDLRINPTYIYWDLLVLPVAVGPSLYRKSLSSVFKAHQKIKTIFPETKFIAAISNISYGLPPQIRQVLNSIFFHLCEEKEINFAILNIRDLLPLKKIPVKQQKICLDVLNHPTNLNIKKLNKMFAAISLLSRASRGKPKT